MQPQSTKFGAKTKKGKGSECKQESIKDYHIASIDMIAENQDSKYIVTQEHI